MKQRLQAIEKEALDAINSGDSSTALEAVRLKYFGQKSELKSVLAELKSLSPEDKKIIGQLANIVQQNLSTALKERQDTIHKLELNVRLSCESIDVTLPGSGRPLGHIHPLTQISQEIIDVFRGMGFSVVDGPEIETDYYNFEALNTPEDHPARDSQDTFYTNAGPHVLLRSQTSTMQIRAMEKMRPPLRIIAPGRVYRNEEINARKYPLFHQIEGLLIDRNVTFGQLRGTLSEFYRLLFGKELKTRFRPDFFPFTEPSAELDCQCPFCSGKGCRTCGQRGWLEMLGCGMVDPNVLSAVGIDPSIWSGFAFGMGVERVAMLKYDINDIRHFYTNDLRFLEQF
ncbi:MAG: phenylalanine--tRNA ligase subunit alpha [Candidatus Obscuribacterales bacterium]|nr:phenylalanine--tRNA ligase subunit alpha [Candidatus Obscuribacterales bacterium]